MFITNLLKVEGLLLKVKGFYSELTCKPGVSNLNSLSFPLVENSSHADIQ